MSEDHQTWERIARDIYACRDCRGTESLARSAFASFVGGAEIPPEAADSPECVDILFVSANPQGLAARGVVPDLGQYLSPGRRTYSKQPWQADRFVNQSLKVLPSGQSWWESEGTPIGNTRACRCPSTSGWSRTFDWAAEHCTRKFLRRELAALRPKVLVVMGAMPKKVISQELGITLANDPDVHSCCTDGWSGTVVFSRHPSQGASDAYLATVRAIVESALDGRVPVQLPEGNPRAAEVNRRSTTTSRRGLWHDLEATPALHSLVGRREEDARPGTTIHVALTLTGRPIGATLDEVQQGLRDAGLGHHDAHRLLRWLSAKRGWGFTMDPAGRIHLLR